MHRPTIKDIAQRAKVSLKTVSRVINNEASVRGPTRDRVQRAIEEPKYEADQSARSLRTAMSYAIGLVYDNPNPYYVISVQNGVPAACRDQGFGLQIHPYDSTAPDVEESPSAVAADFVIPLRAGPELSVAATKSFLCSLSAILQLAAEWKDDAALRNALRQVPAALDDCAKMDWQPLIDGVADAQSLFVVGRGLGLAAAQEAALKLKETCGIHAEAFSAAEVQHGPMTLVGPGFPVVFFVPGDDTEESTLAVARKFRARGARVWTIGADAQSQENLPLPAVLDAACTPLVAVHRFDAAVNELAVRRGRNPDAPPHLRKVTATV